MHSYRVALALLLASCLLLLSCQRVRRLLPLGGADDGHVTLGVLPPDPLAAARLVGEAAATEKDPERLAGLVAAFMQRLQVPIVNAAGTDFLVKGYVTNPPGQVVLFERPLYGLAKATSAGDARLLSTVVKAFMPGADPEKVRQWGFGPKLARNAREARARKLTTPDALVIVALATDLEKRGQIDKADPRLDPVGSLLLGLWLMTGVPPYKGPPPAELTRPYRRPAAKRAPLQGVMKDLDLEGLGTQMSVSGLCSWVSKASKFNHSLAGGLSGGSGPVGWLGAGTRVGDFAREVGGALAPWKLANTIAQGLAGMGIAAVIDVTGEVKPQKTWYGGPTVYYEVFVDSKNPLDKAQLDKLVDCLSALSGPAGGIAEELRNLPPKGPVEGAWVTWTGLGALDPAHGSFNPDNSITSAAGGMKGGMNSTGKDGKSKAKFRPKQSKGKEHKLVKVQHVTIFANVHPFPMGFSPVYVASNVISSREVPLAVELEVPLPKNWLFEFTEEDLITGEEVDGGWTATFKLSIPFTLDDDLRFDSPGQGQWTMGFKGGFGDILRCEAPAAPKTFSAKVWGRVANTDTMMTEFNLNGKPSGGPNTSLRCTTGDPNIKLKGGIPLQGLTPLTANAIMPPFTNFSMPLESGSTRTWSFSEKQGKATRHVKGTVTLTPRE
jgi:hypothetical protein